MKLAMHQITTGGGRDLRETFRAYAETGWHHFEINLGECKGFVDEYGNAKLAELVHEYDLTCVGATGLPIRAFGGADARRENEATLRSYAETMQTLGCRAIVCGGDVPQSDTFPPHAKSATERDLFARDATYRTFLEQFADEVGRLADIADDYGVALALEVNWCGMARSIRTMAELVELVDRENVGAVWDPAHFFSTPSRLDDLELLDGKIVHAHMNDIRDCVIEAMNINSDRVIPGDGILPLHELSDVITSLGYSGWHCVELFSDDLWAESVESICRTVKTGCERVWPNAEF